MAVTNFAIMKNLSKNFPNKLYISLDDLHGKTMIHGWVKKSGKDTKEILFEFNKSNIQNVCKYRC